MVNPHGESSLFSFEWKASSILRIFGGKRPTWKRPKEMEETSSCFFHSTQDQALQYHFSEPKRASNRHHSCICIQEDWMNGHFLNKFLWLSRNLETDSTNSLFYVRQTFSFSLNSTLVKKVISASFLHETHVQRASFFVSNSCLNQPY